MKKKLLAEAIGTMVLVLMGCGAAVFNQCSAINAASVLITAVAFGLAVVAMAYTIGGVSGCHINPAITLGAWLSGRMEAKEAGLYIVAQVVGAFAGSAILFALTSGTGYEGTGANSYGEGNLVPALIAEIVFTFIFVLVVLGTTAKENGSPKFAGLIIGLTLILVHIVCIPITGTSVNPARSLAPAVFAGGESLSQVWVFLTAPFVGAILATWAWRALEAKE
ncbi:MAG: MIP family channel protein [Rikenellaceae bacterium]